jgi:subtilisin family serine protease
MLRFANIIAVISLWAPTLATSETAKYAPGEVLVMVHDNGPSIVSSAGALKGDDRALSGLLEQLGLDQAKAVTVAGNDRVLKLVGAGEGLDPVAAARDLVASGLVRAASPNYYLDLCVVPNDPLVTYQWHIQDAGDADIDLPEAWDIAQGDPGAIIAIIDTGLDWNHPDLAAAVWLNPDEIAGNGLDDDRNGLIDDLRGWDFGNNGPDPSPDPLMSSDGIDMGFHGTHCAGIAAASTNNNVGIAGAGAGCSLMGLKVVDTAGNVTTESLVAAMNYAVTSGASVISLSLGGTFEDFGFLQAAVDDAVAANVVCVAAAGNSGTDTRLYPAALDGVISVGATNSAHQRASFSSYGSWVDVAAPGEGIWSTINRNYEWDYMTQLIFSWLFGWDGTNPYMFSDGTSMATPLVAGVCGLIKSVSPNCTPDQVLQLLTSTGDAEVYDFPIGVKVNARAALFAASASAAPLPSNFQAMIQAVYPNPLNPVTKIEFSIPTEDAVRLSVHDLRGHLVRVLVDGRLTAGEHAAVWDGRDAAGRMVASGTYSTVLTTGGHRDTRTLTLLK